MAKKILKKATNKKPAQQPVAKKVMKASKPKVTKSVTKASKKSEKLVVKKAEKSPISKLIKSTSPTSKSKVSSKSLTVTKKKAVSKTPSPSKKVPAPKKASMTPVKKSNSIIIKKTAVSPSKKASSSKVVVQPTITARVVASSNLENKKPVNKPISKTDAPSSTSNGMTRYNDQDLAMFKKLIDDKLDHARKELTYLQEQIVEMNENNADIQGSDWFDDSSIHAEVELLNNMAIRQRQFIQNLDNALIRIENKSYGICTITGTLIDKKRLMLVPHATKSIEAKHIEQASMVPTLNQVAPDERVLRRSAEGKAAKKAGTKKTKGKSSRDFDEDESEDMAESQSEDMDIQFSGGDD